MDKLIITVGNPNGVGPEIVFKSMKNFSGILEKFSIILEKEIYKNFFKDLKGPEYIFVENELLTDYKYKPGVKDELSGLASYLFLEEASKILKSHLACGVITAPISKELIVKAGIKDFVDHTSYFGKVFESKTFMLFYSEKLKVILATIHVPLKDVSKLLTPQVLEDTINAGISFCEKTIGKKFKIAVCGINPHAGEDGLLGDEEKSFISIIENFKRRNFEIYGPLPADTVFYRALRGEFDLIVAAYHDQGLAPFKMLYFNEGVNVTLGLPFVRTSPDHGCAFDIAGKNIANESSMVEAIKLALKLSGLV
ncbi:MAG: 4-hydroxythreonine-4-phosphate dehydrogenase PdxA [Brevinematia bacterium]